MVLFHKNAQINFKIFKTFRAHGNEQLLLPQLVAVFAAVMTLKSADTAIYPVVMLSMKENPDFLIQLDM